MSDEPPVQKTPLYALNFRVATAEEQEARRKDPTWHRTHYFVEGWGWSRGDGAQVLRYQCPEFETLDEAAKEAAWRRIKAADDAVRARIAEAHVELMPLTEVTFPKVLAKHPGISISELLSVQPMTRPQ